MKNIYNRHLNFAKMSVPFNLIMAVGKIAFGVISLSYFLCINALFNIGIAIAKFFAIKTYNNQEKITETKYTEKQYKCYKIIGFILILSSITYLLYCIRMILGYDAVKYNQIVAIGIATFTFVEIFISVKGIIITRKDKEPVFEALKFINLATSLISLVLTQTALLSFTTNKNMSFYNGLSGIIFGSVSVLIGVYMILHSKQLLTNKKFLLKLKNMILFL